MDNQILLVEGKDDFFVVCEIFEKHQIQETFKAIDKKGRENLLKSIPIHTKTDVATIGIIIDADTDISTRWDSLKSILSQIGYNVPKQPKNTGTILYKEDLPNFGIWIMPDNDTNGMLEDFVKYLVPENDEMFRFVEKSLSDLETLELNKYKPIHKSKAKIHTWLAWQESPGTPMGLAIKNKYLETDSELCQKFVNWVNELFNKKLEEKI